MREIVSIINQKGGSGKTTTAYALGTGLYKKGFKVLFIDLDGQANLTSAMQVIPSKSGILDLLTNKVRISEIVQKIAIGDVLVGSEDLFQADMNVVDVGKEYRLKEALADVKEEYDYVIIDTPPALSILTINALVASDSAIITSQAERFNSSGVDRISKVIETIRNHRNKSLVIKGVLLTRFKERTRLNRDFAKLLKEFADKLGTKVFKATIRDSIVISEAQAKRIAIFDYAPKSNVTEDYRVFIEEFLQ
ncbi:MAG: ParA family protein [Endomicrobium sp.]|nr:ParA family protein [Endomicrobium sp.]